MLKKYQNNIEEILKELDLDNVFVNIQDYDHPVSLGDKKEIGNWYIDYVFTNTGKKRLCLIGRSKWLWNEEIEPQIIELRKKCLEKFDLDIILLDYDICAYYNLHDNKHTLNINQKTINYFQHISKKGNLGLKYLLTGYGENCGILAIFENLINPPTKKQIKYIMRLHRWCLKHDLVYTWNIYRI